MRIRNFHLIKYGKFTGTSLTFPKNEHDFHVVIGPNEAGKSTIRGAIGDLLFDMPTRSGAMAFKHEQRDLRLGAFVENATGELDFLRLKANKVKLRTPAEAALPDTALDPFVGVAGRPFFEQMYGLDHTMMVEGGKFILDASKDVAQVLFQSAAGIASLGKVKDALVQEAAAIWTSSSAAGRTYYAALAQLNTATQELKDSAVRTKAWTDAHAAEADAQTKVDQADAARRGLEQRRATLERVRRLAPFVATLRAREEDLKTLIATGSVLELPSGSSTVLTQGEAAVSSTGEVLKLRDDDVGRLQGLRDQVTYDQAVLTRKVEVDDLEAFRHRVRDHAKDLLLRQQEVDQELERMRRACAELGWPDSEAEVRLTLPPEIALKTVTTLVKERGALELAKTTSQESVDTKERDLAAVQKELDTFSVKVVTEELRSALEEAQTAKGRAPALRTLMLAGDTAKQTLERALAALGRWTQPLAALRTMDVPATERLAAMQAHRSRLVTAVEAAQERADESAGKLETTRLAVDQVVATKHIVTAEDVRLAREERDKVWSSVKSHALPLEAGAPALDFAIEHADRQVDVQLGSTSEAAQLLALRQQLQREEAEQDRLAQALTKRTAELEEFDRNWATESAGHGLNGMLLEDVSAWFIRREAVLTAAAQLESKQAELAREQEATEVARVALRGLLDAAGFACSPDMGLVALCATADGHIKSADATVERRKALVQQLDQGGRALETLRATALRANQALQTWESEWAAALLKAKLSASSRTVAEAEAAIEQVGKVHSALEKAASIRAERIDTMNADLDRFQGLGRDLARELVPDAEPDADIAALSKSLGERLARAVSEQQAWVNADENLAAAVNQRDEARVKAQEALATVKPLLDAAGVSTLAEARPLVERSDRLRQLQAEITSAKDELLKGGDGLSLEDLVAEVDAADLAALPGEQDEIKRALEASTGELTALAELRLTTKQALEAISGRANAAVAESKRQEALAALADASERYLKVATASKLLRWAIDRYRDRKQGPLLQRAGEIFGGLTLGGFKTLHVDYDKQPPALTARRSNDALVEVSGLSEGTRDQLYLALRLAALELQLSQGGALPFVADDLFINFDDARAKAGLRALKELSKFTQVIFLSHHDHLLPLVREVFGEQVNVVELGEPVEA